MALSAKNLIAIFVFSNFSLGLPFAAFAQSSPSSTYERFALEKCPQVSEEERSVLSRCAFKKGPALLIDFHEHGVDVMPDPTYFGHAKGAKPANFDSSRTGHFGNLVTNAKGQTAIEWRVKLVAGAWQPFAAIYRTSYNEVTPSGDNRTRRRLDVLKFGPDHACQIGVVDANEPNHNVTARQIADNAMDTNPCPAVN